MATAKLRMLTVLILAFNAQGLRAETLSFEDVWRAIDSSSPAQKAVKIEVQAEAEGKDRAARHWFPKLYLDAKSYQTNDPGSSFFGILQQRSVLSSDFVPTKLNQPDEKIYSRGALGVDLPLYEGGMRHSEEKMRTHLLEAKQQEAKALQAQQYAEVAKAYGGLMVLEKQKNDLKDIQNTTDKIIKSYQLGNRSNPVGYSGMLGLKTLANRIRGSLSEAEAKARAQLTALNEMGLHHDSAWSPQSVSSPQFVEKYMTSNSELASANVLALKAKATAASEAVGMEKSRALPRIGLFAEDYVFSGNRSTDTGYTVGVYMQWMLYNPNDYGLSREAQLRSAAAGKYTEALQEREKIEQAGLREAGLSLRENLRLMQESHQMLQEQTKIAETLFRNGSINVLQFVEVLARRTDLVVSHAEAELGLIRVEADRLLKVNFTPAFVSQQFEGARQ